jgi:hypothetical protein
LTAHGVRFMFLWVTLVESVDRLDRVW